jgi:hypothetical protein
MKTLPRSLFVGAAIYVTAFLMFHLSTQMRQPAANVQYWYYNDNGLIEAVCYYGFWPLRRLAYHFPGFESRHNYERLPSVISSEDLM